MKVHCDQHKKHHKSCTECVFQTLLAEKTQNIRQAVLDEVMGKLGALVERAAASGFALPVGLSRKGAYMTALMDIGKELQPPKKRS